MKLAKRISFIKPSVTLAITAKGKHNASPDYEGAFYKTSSFYSKNILPIRSNVTQT
jgi:hypothetical protein